MSPIDATQRFSDRVDAYVRYRPSYPPQLINTLQSEFGLHAGQTVGDVGSGTGISARLFLDAGCAVHAIEPNSKMRAAAERDLANFPGFCSYEGTAEQTPLPSSFLDWYVAAQAFHWFDVPAARLEAQRIIKPDGRVLLVWNDRRSDSPFLEAYERFLHEHGTDYAQVTHRNVLAEARVPAFLGCEPAMREFPYSQQFDWEGLRGRALSSSYIPGPTHQHHGPMLVALREVFDRFATAGLVEFQYVTRAFVGKMR